MQLLGSGKLLDFLRKEVTACLSVLSNGTAVDAET